MASHWSSACWADSGPAHDGLLGAHLFFGGRGEVGRALETLTVLPHGLHGPNVADVLQRIPVQQYEGHGPAMLEDPVLVGDTDRFRCDPSCRLDRSHRRETSEINQLLELPVEGWVRV